jgi:hypothetical protein
MFLARHCRSRFKLAIMISISLIAADSVFGLLPMARLATVSHHGFPEWLRKSGNI